GPGRQARTPGTPSAGSRTQSLSAAVMASLSLSTVPLFSKTALRNRVTHGDPEALNACWKFTEYGVRLFGSAATWLTVTTRGSAEENSLSVRSVRAPTSPFLASTPTWASSDISQAMKFHAWSAT